MSGVTGIDGMCVRKWKIGQVERNLELSRWQKESVNVSSKLKVRGVVMGGNRSNLWEIEV